MTALKSDEKADLPTDLAVLPIKLSYCQDCLGTISLYFCLRVDLVDVTFCRFYWKSFVFALSLKCELQQTTSALFSVLMTNLFLICIREKKDTFILTILSYLQQVESKILTFQCQNSNLDSRSCRSFDKSHSTVDDRQLRLTVCWVLSNF